MVVGDISAAITSLRGLGCNVFDGVDDYVEIPHNDAQLGANLSNGFTFSAWINARSAGELGGRILDKSEGNNGQNGFAFRMSGAGNNNFNVTINTANRNTANNSIVYGTWQHLLATATAGGTVTCYINGAISGTAGSTTGLTAITTTQIMRVGNRSQGTDYSFDGSIKDVKMWNRVLTASEIAADYAGIHNGVGCIHYFKLNGDYNDYGSVGVTATNSGSLPSIVDDQVAAVLKTQYAAAGKALSGAYMTISGTPSGQIYSTCIQTKT